MKKMLVIDDEPGHRLMVRAVMQDAGWSVVEAPSGEEGVAIFSADPDSFAVALVDMKMPGMNGQQTLKSLHAIRQNLPVILLTAYGTVGSAVEAMKQGAFDYLTKPADNDELVLTLDRAYEYSNLLQENNRLKSERSSEDSLSAIVGTSIAIRKIHELIRQAGPSEATVLITGESGTGKERIAEALHASSSRCNKPLIKVNCAALPGHLLESELFGYERGAFTGAIKDKPGRFMLAQGGTLFLDEIGEIPLDLQAKLLRALQEREIEPLGSIKTRPVDVRILAATNKNLKKAIQAGEFREDLFFRLNVLEIVSPPLREHTDDIPILVSYLLKNLAERNRKSVRGVSPAFLQALVSYNWPGNVRELENVLERALILSRADILEADALPPALASANHLVDHEKQQLTLNLEAPALVFTPHAEPSVPVSPQPTAMPPRHDNYYALTDINKNAYPHDLLHSKEQNHAILAHQEENATMHKNEFVNALPPLASDTDGTSPLEQAEKAALIRALTEQKGHREKTAEALGISRRTLQYKLKKFGLNKR